MKKLLSMLIAFSMIWSVAGCNKNTQKPVSEQPTTISKETVPTTLPTINAEIPQKPMCAVSLVPQTETFTDSDGKVRFIHSIQNLTLVLPEPEIADRIILDQLNRQDQIAQYADELHNDSLNSAFFYDIPFMYCISYTPARFDSILLSLHEDEMIFMGGIHPNTYGHFYNYDLLSGKKLNLSDILTDDTTLTNITDIIKDRLNNVEFLWDDYAAVISEQFECGLHEYGNWYFSNDGLCFYFDPYVLAPYAAGPITAEISYSSLVGILKDEYFPAEADYFNGTLVISEFNVDAQEDFTQFSEVILTADGTKLLLSSEGAITDITILAETVQDGSTATVMAVQSLTPGDAVMVEFDSATTRLIVNYNNGNQQETQMISYTNGSITIS